MASTQTRREHLGSLAAGVTAAVAGCVDTESGAESAADTTDTATRVRTEPSDRTATSTSRTEGSAPADGTRTAGDDLDLREANVTAVAVECADDECRFDVTLYHDDGGEDGYADWWQVETRDGERLGRRELVHAHGTRAFTRSETVHIPEGVHEVVVRGHDQTHGYGGRAMLVDLDTEETMTVRQGREPDSFTG